MSLDKLFNTAKKFEKKYLFAQEIRQQDNGTAEDDAFRHSGAFAKISNYLKTKNLSECNVKVFMTITVNNIGQAISANINKFDIYCNNADFDLLDKINNELLLSIGPNVAQTMLDAYKTNSACKKVLQNQYKENPISNQVVVVKAQMT